MILKNNIGKNNQLEKIESTINFQKKIKFFIESIKISQFRNHKNLILNLSKGPIILYGSNGIGKTNILEAISFLNPGRGLRRAKSKDIFSYDYNETNKNNPSWGVNADIVTPDGRFNIGTGSTPNKNSRIVKINSIESNQLELSKIFKISWVTPQMLLLFHTSMKEKRQFIDRLVNYLNPSHMSYVYKFEKLIRERSKIINDFKFEELWLESLEKNIINLSILITQNRHNLMSEINKINLQQLDKLQDSDFPLINIHLDSLIDSYLTNAGEIECKNKLINMLRENRKNQSSYFPGPHNSNVSIVNLKSKKEINFCSTGEQKIMLISLILNHSKLLENYYNFPPILLLDDIVEHLDKKHKQSLFLKVSKHKSQCWFTSTNLKYFKNFPIPYKAISVDNLQSTSINSKELVYA